jgi:hypothetical protein
MTEEKRRKLLAERIRDIAAASPSVSFSEDVARELERQGTKLDIDIFHQTHPDSDHAVSKVAERKLSAIWLPSETRIYTNRRVIWPKSEDAHVNPPGLGEALLIIFAPTRRADAMLGDLAERFNDDVEKKGLKRARLLYWARVLRSIGPMIWAKVRKAGIFVAMYEIGRRWMGS